jgi:hypothetical protein
MNFSGADQNQVMKDGTGSTIEPTAAFNFYPAN